MTKLIHSFIDPKKISLWRFQDPVVGPRKIPTSDDIEKGKVELNEANSFVVDVEKKSVSITENGQHVDIGSSLIYVVA